MKAHDLAAQLLALPNMEVFIYDQHTSDLHNIVLVDDAISDRIDINIDSEAQDEDDQEEEVTTECLNCMHKQPPLLAKRDDLGWHNQCEKCGATYDFSHPLYPVK